jgi:hypothetical protein
LIAAVELSLTLENTDKTIEPQSFENFHGAHCPEDGATRKSPKKPKNDYFFPQSQRAKERGWTMLQFTSDPNLQWLAPEALAEMLLTKDQRRRCNEMLFLRWLNQHFKQLRETTKLGSKL